MELQLDLIKMDLKFIAIVLFVWTLFVKGNDNFLRSYLFYFVYVAFVKAYAWNLESGSTQLPRP